MSQKTLNSYFSVKKRPVNQHAAKSRKLETSQVSNALYYYIPRNGASLFRCTETFRQGLNQIVFFRMYIRL